MNSENKTKWYALVEFRNGGVILPDSKLENCLTAHDNNIGSKCFYGHYSKKEAEAIEDFPSFTCDVSNPIPWKCVSNALHVLNGEIPVPTKRKSKLQRIPLLDEIAKNAKIRIFNPLITNERGYILGAEKFQTQKWNWNSKRKIKTDFTIFDETTSTTIKTIPGWYNWRQFYCTVREKENQKQILDFIESIIGCNPRTLTLKQTVFELSKHWNNPVFKKTVSQILPTFQEITQPWKYLFFNDYKKENEGILNTSYGKRYMTEIHGFELIYRFNGEILFEFDDINIFHNLTEKGSGSATFLDGGIMFLKSIEKYKPYTSMGDDWVPIFKS